jgi:hypothetical protein
MIRLFATPRYGAQCYQDNLATVSADAVVEPTTHVIIRWSLTGKWECGMDVPGCMTTQAKIVKRANPSCYFKRRGNQASHGQASQVSTS